MWEPITFSYADLANCAGLSLIEVQSAFNRLRLLKLVYPDGTINKIAKQILSLRVGVAINNLTSASHKAFK